METNVITTPSGHKVTIKTTLSYGEDRQIKRAAVGQISVNQKTKQAVMDGSAMFDAQDLALKLIVQKIELKDGNVVTGADQILETIMTWSKLDGDYLYDEIDKITAPPTAEQKKGA